MTVLGIDIGSSYCVLATIDKGAVVIIRNELSDRLTPALVSFTEKDRMIGDAALTQIKSNYKNTCRYVKQLLGLTEDDLEDVTVENDFSLCPIEFSAESDGGLAGHVVEYKNCKQIFVASRILGALLTKLKETAEKSLSHAVQDVVISVPGWASDRARKAVLDAAEIAGFKCLRTMNEHTAVALDYGIYRSNSFDAEKGSRVAFVSVGHATSSVTVVEYFKGKGSLMAFSSTKRLGGRDVDRLIMMHFVSVFQKQYGINLLENKKTLLKLEDVASKTKKILSANSDATYHIECVADDHDLSGVLTRSELEALCSPLQTALLDLLQSSFTDNGLSPNDIHHIELIGGCTRSPWIQNTISKFFNNSLPLSKTLSMDETVARGCALQAAMLDPRYRVRDFQLVDVLLEPIMVSYPVSTEEGEKLKTSVLFDKGSQYGVKKWLTFNRDRDFTVQIRPPKTVLENRIRIPETDHPGVRRVKVSVLLSLHGTTSVDTAQLLLDEEVEELVTEKRPKPRDPNAPADAPEQFEEIEVPKKKIKTKKLDCEISISHCKGYLSSEALAAFKSDEAIMIMEDIKNRETADMMNDLESYIYQIRDFLGESGRLHPFCDVTLREQILDKLSSVQDWLYETENGTRDIFEEKLLMLKELCLPVERRWQEYSSRQEESRLLMQRLAELNEAVLSPEWSHVEDTKRKSLVSKLAETEQWLHKLLTTERSLPLSSDFGISSKQIADEREGIINFSKTILVPKPAVVEEHANQTPDTVASPEVTRSGKFDEEPVDNDKMRDDAPPSCRESGTAS